jgi:serine protease Do
LNSPKIISLLIIISAFLNPVYLLGDETYRWVDENRNLNPVEYSKICSFVIKGENNLGTGFFISSNGFAITCKHVIEDDENHVAILSSQEEYPIGIIASSDKYDLAVILVTTPQKTPYLQLRDPFSMKPGDHVYAVGSSSGHKPTITDGLFTAIRKKLPTDDRTIQFSASINPGNSGGPLIDKHGKVLGVVSWKLVSSRGLPVADEIGFAVPSDYLIEEYGSYME